MKDIISFGKKPTTNLTQDTKNTGQYLEEILQKETFEEMENTICDLLSPIKATQTQKILTILIQASSRYYTERIPRRT